MRLRTWHANQMQSFDSDRTKHGERSTEHGAWNMEYSVYGARVSISHGLGLCMLYAAMPQTAVVCVLLFLSARLFYLLCANFVQIDLLLSQNREERKEELRQLLYMSRSKLHISNAPALPIGSIFMPLSRQLATGPTVA